MTRSMFVFTFYTSNMTQDEVVAIADIMGMAPCVGAAPNQLVFNREVTELTMEQRDELMMLVFNQHKASAITMTIRVICPRCEQPCTPETNACGKCR